MSLSAHFLFDIILSTIRSLNCSNPDVSALFQNAEQVLNQYIEYKRAKIVSNSSLDEYMEALFYTLLARISNVVEVSEMKSLDAIDKSFCSEVAEQLSESPSEQTEVKHRDNHPEEAIQIFHDWIRTNHSDKPSKSDAELLALKTGLTPVQIRTWFANYRKRKVKDKRGTA